MEKTNEQIVTEYYNQWEENERVSRDHAHMTEFYITMHYIEQYLTKECRIIEVGCGMGRDKRRKMPCFMEQVVLDLEFLEFFSCLCL